MPPAVLDRVTAAADTSDLPSVTTQAAQPAGKRKRKGWMAGVPEQCVTLIAPLTAGPSAESLEGQVDAFYGAAPDDAADEAQEIAEGASLETRIEAVRQALMSYLGWVSSDDADWSLYPSVQETTSDSVLYRRGAAYYRAPYSYDEASETATISGEPQEYRQVYVAVGEAVKETAAAAVREVPARRTAVLCESILIDGARREDGVLTVTLIRAGWSMNNRYYPADLLRASVSKLEGVRAFGDHDGPNDLPERSIWDQVGYYRNVSFDEGESSIKGELKLVGGAEKKEHILAWAEESIAAGAPLVGLSINAIGSTEQGEAEGREGPVVASLDEFNSVDVVTRPAAGGRFERLAASAAGDLTAALLRHLDYDEWREANPEYAARLREQYVAEQSQQSLRESETAADAAQQQLAERDRTIAAMGSALTSASRRLDQYVRADRAAEALAQARIPFRFRGPLAAQLVAIDEQQWGGFLVAEARKLALMAQAAPVSVAGAGPLGPTREAARYEVPTAQDGEDVRQYQRRIAASAAGART